MPLFSFSTGDSFPSAARPRTPDGALDAIPERPRAIRRVASQRRQASRWRLYSLKKGFIWAIPRPGGKGGTRLCPEFLAVVPTVLGVQGDDGGALLGGDQTPSVFVMAGLTAGFAAVVVLARGRFGMGMLGAGRWDELRGGPGVAGFGVVEPGQQDSDVRSDFQRLPAYHLFRDNRFVRHNDRCRRNPCSQNDKSAKTDAMPLAVTQTP